MTPHTHATYTPGCYRCELSRDEATEGTDNLHTSAPPLTPSPTPEAQVSYWRMRAEEAEEVVGTLQLHNERLREALDILIDIINSAMRAAESRAHKANDTYEEAVFARVPPFADTANIPLAPDTEGESDGR